MHCNRVFVLYAVFRKWTLKMRMTHSDSSPPSAIIVNWDAVILLKALHWLVTPALAVSLKKNHHKSLFYHTCPKQIINRQWCRFTESRAWKLKTYSAFVVSYFLTSVLIIEYLYLFARTSRPIERKNRGLHWPHLDCFLTIVEKDTGLFSKQKQPFLIKHQKHMLYITGQAKLFMLLF